MCPRTISWPHALAPCTSMLDSCSSKTLACLGQEHSLLHWFGLWGAQTINKLGDLYWHFESWSSPTVALNQIAGDRSVPDLRPVKTYLRTSSLGSIWVIHRRFTRTCFHSHRTDSPVYTKSAVILKTWRGATPQNFHSPNPMTDDQF